MKPRTVAKATAVTGWCAGMTGILAGWPLAAAATTLAVAVTAALAALRWGQLAWGALAGLKVAVRLRRMLKTMGTAVDRA